MAKPVQNSIKCDLLKIIQVIIQLPHIQFYTLKITHLLFFIHYLRYIHQLILILVFFHMVASPIKMNEYIRPFPH